MGKLIGRCAGIDNGKRFLVCCVMTGAAYEEPRSETRRFDTTVPGLKRLRSWLNEEIAGLARGSAKRKTPQLIEAIEGNGMSDHVRFLIRGCLRHRACLEEEVEELDAEILRRMQLSRFQKAFTLLQTIPGVGQLSAATILAETGPDLDAFPTIEQMSSWAGLCPGNRESAGIQKGPQTTHGNPYLCTALVQCAWAATRKRDSVFRSRFQRLAPRRGEKRAIIAVAHHMLIILYCMLKRGVPFLGAEHAPKQRRRERRAHHHLRCLRRLGFSVEIRLNSESTPPDTINR
jgi:transposase